MTLLGSHISIAGGYHRAVEKGAALHLSAIQIFPKNQLQWASKQLSDGEIESYRESRSKHPEIAIVFAHGSYLYNFASPEDALVEKSKACLTNELVLCEIAATYLQQAMIYEHAGDTKRSWMNLTEWWVSLF